jgi:outer membrane autotransporter protein
LTKLGNGVLALVGNNTYKGGTRIESGVLQLGMGGASGSITGNVVNNAILAFHRSDELVFPDIISGTGSLETYGGTLRLQGENTYEGGTNVNGGMLAVDGSVVSGVNVNNGGRLGGTGSVRSLVVRDGGTIAPGNSVGTLHVIDDVRFEEGSLYEVEISKDKSIADKLNIRGTATLLGGTVSVRMEGSSNPLSIITTEELFLRRYDILSAEKGVKNTFATVTPQYNYITGQLDYTDGNRVTLYFDLTQEAKSEDAIRKKAELKTRERDLANVAAQRENEPHPEQQTPAADPDASHVETIAAPRPGSRPAIPTDGGADYASPLGQTAVIPNAHALEADIRHRKLDLLGLRFRELELLGATTPNHKSIGESLKSLGFTSGHPLVNGLLGSKVGVVPDFDSLTGEVHATLLDVLSADSRLVSRAALDHLRLRGAGTTAANQRPSNTLKQTGQALSRNTLALASASRNSFVWMQAYGGSTHAKGDGNASGYEGRSGGVIMGADGAVGADWRLGLLMSVGETSLSAGSGRASVDNYRLGIYGGTQVHEVGLRLGANVARHQITTKRQAHWFGLTENNEASYGATSVELYGEAGYRMATPVAAFEPFVGLSYVNLRTGHFEEGGSVTGLAGRSGAANTTVATTGVHVSREFKPSYATAIAVRGMVGWSQVLGDTAPRASLGFVGGDSVYIQGPQMARNRTTVELGIDANFSQNTTFDLAYTKQFAGAFQDNVVKANVRFRF